MTVLTLLATALVLLGGTTPAAFPAHVAPPSSPPSAARVELSLVRIDGGSGPTLVSSGVPLAPGMLRAADVPYVRVLVGDREQAAYLEPLRGRHPDGSVAALLVQFRAPVAHGRPAPAVLDIGTRASVTRLPRSTADRSRPSAAALPASASYLVSTMLVGPTRTVSEASRATPAIRKFDADFADAADRHWRENGPKWEENYYDRALVYYAAWVRTANPEYWRRGTLMAAAYRRDYLEANKYGATPHWAQLDGVALHYLLTGDEASRRAVGEVAQRFAFPYYMDNLQDPTAEMENRMQARVLTSFVLANWIDAPVSDTYGTQGRSWAALARAALTKILASQASDGAYRFTRANNQCGYNKPFMVGILNDALIRYYARFERDPRIPPAVRRSLDYMWAKNWLPRERAFVYIEGRCHGDGPGAVADLNNLMVNGFAWYAHQSGNAVYRERADRIFEGAVAAGSLAGSKQFNQQYTNAYNYLGYRATR